MNRIVATALAAVLAAVLTGCGSKEKKDSRELPSASDLFDKMEVPKRKGKHPGGKADPG